jgi:hypothetical protein
MPLTRRGSHCSMVPLDVIAEAGLASTLPHIWSGRLVVAGAHERISGAGDAHVGSLRAPASPAEAGVALSSDAHPRLVPSGRQLSATGDARISGIAIAG